MSSVERNTEYMKGVEGACADLGAVHGEITNWREALNLQNRSAIRSVGSRITAALVERTSAESDWYEAQDSLSADEEGYCRIYLRATLIAAALKRIGKVDAIIEREHKPT
jgi:hypothetical protein